MGSAPWAAALLPAVAVPTWGPVVLLSVATARNSFCGCSGRAASQGPVLPADKLLYLRELKEENVRARWWLLKPQSTSFRSAPVAQSYN